MCRMICVILMMCNVLRGKWVNRGLPPTDIRTPQIPFFLTPLVGAAINHRLIKCCILTGLFFFLHLYEDSWEAVSKLILKHIPSAVPKAEVEIRSTSSVAQEPASERVKFTVKLYVFAGWKWLWILLKLVLQKLRLRTASLHLRCPSRR